jgi:hypothetical protein
VRCWRGHDLGHVHGHGHHHGGAVLCACKCCAGACGFKQYSWSVLLLHRVLLLWNVRLHCWLSRKHLSVAVEGRVCESGALRRLPQTANAVQLQHQVLATLACENGSCSYYLAIGCVRRCTTPQPGGFLTLRVTVQAGWRSLSLQLAGFVLPAGGLRAGGVLVCVVGLAGWRVDHPVQNPAQHQPYVCTVTCWCALFICSV